MQQQEQLLASVLDAYNQLNSLQAQGIEQLTATIRHRTGIVTRFDIQHRTDMGIADVASLDNNAALMDCHQDSDKPDYDKVHPTKSTILTQVLEDYFGTYNDVEQQYQTVKRHNLLQTENAPDHANYIANEELSTYEVKSVLDLYKLLKSSTIEQYTVNNRPRLASTVKIKENYLWNGQYRGFLELNLVKSSPMGQAVSNWTGKHKVVDLLRKLARENEEVTAYDQQQARMQLGEGVLDNAYILLDNLNKSSVTSQELYYKPQNYGYHVELDMEDRCIVLEGFGTNRAITTILEDCARYWTADEYLSVILTCVLEEKLEKKYGTWRELKLAALLDVCEAQSKKVIFPHD